MQFEKKKIEDKSEIFHFDEVAEGIKELDPKNYKGCIGNVSHTNKEIFYVRFFLNFKVCIVEIKK